MLRRAEAQGRCIPFHLDYDYAHTMLVPLNGDDEYTGGRLMYATDEGFLVPLRPAGSATIHDNTMVHGVSVMESGVRYGLHLQ